MTQTLISLGLWFCAIGSGIMAGVYFAFSAFIMTSFARLPPSQGLVAMQSINATIVRSLFLPLFFGTTVASLALAVLAVFRWGEPGTATMLGGGIIYVAGMFLCTVAFNVPLNKALAAVDPASPGAAEAWSGYLTVWTRWNHLRTVACIVAAGLFIAALTA